MNREAGNSTHWQLRRRLRSYDCTLAYVYLDMDGQAYRRGFGRTREAAEIRGVELRGKCPR